MDHDDDLAAFGLAEVDADRATGGWDDPHAPAPGAVLTTARVAKLAAFILGDDSVGDTVAKEVARWCLAALPVVAAAEDQADMPEHFDVYQSAAGYAWAGACERTEAAVRAYRAAGGDA